MSNPFQSPTIESGQEDAPMVIARPEGKASIQGILTIADQAIVSLTSFLATVIVGQLGKEQLGIYTLGISMFWLAAGIANAVVWTPYTARASRLPSPEQHRFRASNTLMAFGVAAMLSLISATCGLGVWLMVPNQIWLTNFFLALAPLALTLTMREHVRRLCVADFRGVHLIIFDLPVCVLTLASMLVLWKTGNLTATTAFLATAAAAALSLLVIANQLSQNRMETSHLLKDIRSNWTFGRWLLVVAIAWLVSDGSLRWMLSEMHGMEAMGVFGAAFAVVMLVNPLMLAMQSFARSLATRVFAAGGHQELWRHTVKSTFAAIALAAVGVVVLAIVGEFAIKSIWGAEFADATLVTVLAVGLCLQATYIPADAALTTLELGKRMSSVAVYQLVATVIVGAPLVYLQGPLGIGWAMIARSVPALIMYWITLSQACHRDVHTSERSTTEPPFAEPISLTPSAPTPEPVKEPALR